MWIDYPKSENQQSLKPAHNDPNRHPEERRLPSLPLIVINQGLRPADQRQRTEDLRLYLDGDVEVLHNGIDPEGDGAGSPEEHHQSWQAFGLFLSPIVPYLGDKLNAPQDCADGPEYIGSHRYTLLGCHAFGKA